LVGIAVGWGKGVALKVAAGVAVAAGRETATAAGARATTSAASTGGAVAPDGTIRIAVPAIAAKMRQATPVRKVRIMICSLFKDRSPKTWLFLLRLNPYLHYNQLWINAKVASCENRLVGRVANSSYGIFIVGVVHTGTVALP
jgi:hypothetical protein